ncbi:MAG TPA: hypothetical protein VH703_03815 [Solirubrobacterales bacterium]
MPPEPQPAPREELHIWRARLDVAGWPGPEDLPGEERERAAEIGQTEARRRWVASRWALRTVLGRYLGAEPAVIELSVGERGKPQLAGEPEPLRFNLSHSGELALVAVLAAREVGIDVQRIGRREPGYYGAWAEREAIAKCHGVGLWKPLPDTPVAVAAFDIGPGYTAAVAVEGAELPALQRFDAEPGSSPQ